MKLTSIAILADENISLRVVKFLRGKGIDVLDTKEQNWNGSEDEFLLQQAVVGKRFMLTHDSDFGTLAINEGKEFYGIIFLRLKSAKCDNVIEVLDKLLSMNISVSYGTLVVVGDKKIRIKNVLS